MKALKMFALLVLFVFALVGIGLALLLSPGVQKIIFLKLIEQPETEVSIERVDLGWETLAIEQFHFTQNGTVIDFNELKMELWALSLLFEEEIKIDNLKLTDLTVILPDDSKPSQGAANLSRVNPFVEMGSKLEVGKLEGNFILMRKNRAYELIAPQPIQLKNIFLTQNGRSLIKDVELNTLPKAVFESGFVELFLNEVKMSSNRSLLMTGECSVLMTTDEEQFSIKTIGGFSGHLPPWLEQPMMHDFGNIEAGWFNLAGKIELKQRWNTQLNAQFKNLKFNNHPTHISDAKIDLTGQLNHNGTIDLTVPFTLEGSEGISDGNLQISFQKLEKGYDVNASLTGKQLYPRDLLLLSIAYQPENTSFIEQPVSSISLISNKSLIPPSRHFIQLPLSDIQLQLKPFWSPHTGRVVIDYERINIDSEEHIDNIKSEIHINNDKITIKNFDAVIYESPFSLEGVLNFSTGRAEPYYLDAQAQLTRFDTGAYLKTIEPNSKPVVETVVDITSNLRANGRDLNDLWGKVQGQINLKSEKGIFRALDAAGDNVSTGADLLNLFGSLLGDKVRELRTVNRLTNFLRKINFDSFSIDAIRDNTLDIHLIEFLVKSPDIYFTGQGRVNYQEGTPVFDQPLVIKTQLAAKNEVALLFKELALLKNQKDEQGYTLGPSFSIGGSLSRPDFSDLYQIIFKASKGLLLHQDPQSN